MRATQLQDTLFADDTLIVAETEEKLQHNVNEYQKELSAINTEININNSKTVIVANEIQEYKIKIKEQLFEQVKRYLRKLIEYNDKVNKEISERTENVERLFNMIKSAFFGRKEIPKEIKTQVYQKVVRRKRIMDAKQKE